ncbi:serine protease snake-like isoform X2 [Leptopilina boulardi]|uniref:serine protease snake-like isoform X2 n=1 Tax=Leptopilina boulardi TaxID=63433 RepID=UPI0021F57C88|nr:serine protease snake-like isoform X2 [Leptopilina boulardi]
MHLKIQFSLFIVFCSGFFVVSNALRKSEENGDYKPVSKCGIIETPLIIGGIKAKPQEFPHMAVIGYGKGNEISWQCGGSLISENFILTAAHCVESLDKGPASRVRIGMTNIKNPGSEMQERCVIERIKYPNYKQPSKYDDIALLKLDKPLDFNGDVRPACLGIEPVIPGKFTIATGFGKTLYENIKGSDDLMKIQLEYVSQNICNNSFKIDVGSKSLPNGIKSSMLCAGIIDGGRDTCQGDSGGPLQRVLKEPYCMYSIDGITSFGKFCGFKNSPAVYTKVSFYLDWIENIVWP